MDEAIYGDDSVPAELLINVNQDSSSQRCEGNPEARGERWRF